MLRFGSLSPILPHTCFSLKPTICFRINHTHVLNLHHEVKKLWSMEAEAHFFIFFYLPNGYNTNFSSDPIIFTFCLLMHFISSFHIEYGGKTSKISSAEPAPAFAQMFLSPQITGLGAMAQCSWHLRKTQGGQLTCTMATHGKGGYWK